MPASSQAVGHPVETFCTILDLKDVSLTNFYRVKDYIMAASKIGQDRYPEIMGKFYIINAPWTFHAVYSVIKNFLDEVTINKIDILGGTYKDKLLAQIPAENLPKEFGGACECECPGGCSMSNAGPWRDETVEEGGTVEKDEAVEKVEAIEKETEEAEETEAPAPA